MKAIVYNGATWHTDPDAHLSPFKTLQSTYFNVFNLFYEKKNIDYDLTILIYYLMYLIFLLIPF